MRKGIKELLVDELHDILSSEEQIVKALPELVTAAESSHLKNAFQSHLKETKGHIQRLKKIFKLARIKVQEKTCKAMKGLILECKEVLKEFKKSPVRDAALISKAQRIEHYEISAYGTIRTFAKELRLSTIADLLQETLNEEGNADKKLTKIAEGGLLTAGINHKANLLDGKQMGLKKLVSHPKKASPSRKKVSPSHKKAKATLKKARVTPIKRTPMKKTKPAPRKAKWLAAR